jgi:Dolichyl-phosphate-mannose-protein mannosyltransferase
VRTVIGETERVPSVAWRPLASIAGALLVLLVAFGGRYGFHRDELYFLAAGRHPAWGYPDQPPLTPIIAHLMDLIAPGSVRALRIPAALASTAVTLAAGLTARELGGGRFAQVLAALATGTGLFVLLSGRLLATSTIDLLVWVTLVFIVVRAVRTGRDGLWLVAGLVAGVGLLNKQTPAFLLFGLLVGVVATRPTRRLLASPWLWAGAAVAALLWTPVLVWQARHGWPQLTLAGQIRDEYGTPGERVLFFSLQFLLFSLGATYLWITGLVHLWRERAWRRFRLLAWAWLAVLVAFTITAGQGYYPGGLYPALIAAGAVVVERHPRRRLPVVVAVVASSALLLPAALPILSPATLNDSVWAGGAGETLREGVGWPQLVDQVAAAYRSIPATERPHAAIFTANYGEAGAIDEFGPERGLPAAWSGHNGYGLWGPPPQEATPIVVVWEDGTPDRFFTDCQPHGRVRGEVTNEETERAAVFVCAAPIGGWAAAWPRLVHLSS